MEKDQEEGEGADKGKEAAGMPRKPVLEDDDAVAASKEAPKNVRPCLPACVCAGWRGERTPEDTRMHE